MPVPEEQLRQLNPFAVTFRYDDLDIELISRSDTANLVIEMRRWAEEQVGLSTENETTDGEA